MTRAPAPGDREPIAIVGIGCRLPGGVRSPADYWDLLAHGRDALVDVPADRWSVAKFYEPDPAPGKSRVRRGGFLSDPVADFDAGFFGISPREADYIDPQQRLLLEVAWEAVEDSGTPLAALAGRATGVYVGGFTLDYNQLQFSLGDGEPPTVAAHTATGVVMTMLANRISHAFDFVGPSLAVDTACSSSLVAVHLACQSLWSGESEVALAGGVNLMLAPNFTVAASQGGFLSPTSTSRAFDSRANGYVRGEGAGIVVLKPLAAARRDQDRVYATIRGTAVVQDGRTNGITVPNGDSQELAIRRALESAGVPAESIAYVEAHGTGTPVGDPIEAAAIGRAYRGHGADAEPCWVGSVKTNIGHLEAAAGVAGLVKAALTLHHREIPAHLHLDQVNPAIDLDALRLRVPLAQTPLPQHPVVRAAVNSFGFGGTNAHVVLESAPPPAAPSDQPSTAPAVRPADGLPLLLPIAARSPRALAALAGEYADRLDDGVVLDDLLPALAHRRTHHVQARLAVLTTDGQDTTAALRAALAGEEHPALHVSHPEVDGGGLAFVFTGMGPQWWGMARELLDGSRVFAEAVDRCDASLRPLAGWSLIDELRRDEATSRMDEAAVAQPANFAIQVGLTDLWGALGVRPDAIVGHSAGEVAAAWAAGSLTFADAVTVIHHRARLQHTRSGGGRLLSVALTPEAAADLPAVRSGRLEVAAINSPASVALVGPVGDLDQLRAELTDRGVFARLVPGNVPYHSPAMDPLETELRSVLAGLDPRPAEIPLYSTVTGARLADDERQDASYWWGNVRRPVRFADAAAALALDGMGTFVEIGPQPVLAHAIGDTLAATRRRGRTVASLSRRTPDLESIGHAAAELYAEGRDLDWSAWTPAPPMSELARYPWQRERYWMESKVSRANRLGQVEQVLLGSRVDSATPTWRRVLDGTAPDYLPDHVVHRAPLFPGAGFAEIALEAARAQYGASSCELRDLRFEAPLVQRQVGTYLVDTTVEPDTARVTISGRPPEADRWVRHASATVVPAPVASGVVDLDAAAARCDRTWTAEETYAAFAAAGFDYGPAFRSLAEVHLSDTEAVARLVDGLGDGVADGVADEEGSGATPGHLLHPVVLDACFQLLLPLAISRRRGVTLIPTGVDRLVVHETPRGALHAYARVDPADPADTDTDTDTDKYTDAGVLSGDVTLTDASGRVLVEVHGFRVHVRAADGPAERVGTEWLYEQRWESVEPDQSAPADGTTAATGVWLVLADRGGRGDALADLITERGGRTVVVHADPAVGSTGHAIRPGSRADLARVLDHAADLGALRGVVHLWSCDATGDDDGDLDLSWPLHEAPLSVVNLAAELDSRGLACGLTIVTQGAQPAVRPGDRAITAAGLAQAPLWGLGRVLHHESLGLATRMVDLDPADGSLAATTLLADQILTGDATEDQVAVRDGQWFVARLHPSRRSGGSVPRPIRPDATYLVTGGLGSLGTLFARWLADHGARHLVLTSRSGLPPQEQWDHLPEDHPGLEAISVLRPLVTDGVDVCVEAVDVTDEAALRQLVERRRAAGQPPLAGVIHSAGVVSDQLVIRLDEEKLDHVLRPKIQGGWALHRATLDEPLEFFVLCSSISALVPTPGRATYAAGNAFIDALAHYRRGLGLPALSLNWGPWDVGMIAKLSLQSLYTRRGLDLIDEATGREVLGQLLGSAEVQQGVVSAHWPTVVSNYPLVPKLIEHLGVTAVAGAGDGPSVAERLAAAAPEDHAPIIIEACTEIISAVLRVPADQLSPDEPLNRIGLDSMIAAELRIRLEQACGAAPNVVFLLNNATVTSVAEHISEHISEHIAEHISEQRATDTGAGSDAAGDPDAAAAGVDELAEMLADLDQADLETLLAGLDPPPTGPLHG